MFFSRLVISALKTAVLKREMLLEFMSNFLYKKHTKTTVSVRLDNAGSPYAMYSALKGNTGKNAVLYQLRFKKGHQEFMPHSDM